MTPTDPLEASLTRLQAAVMRLRAAAEQRVQADAARGDREQELMLLQDDRARLAAELDAALGQNERLLAAQDEVFRRLDRAGATVTDIMSRLQPEAANRALAGAA